MLVDLTAWVRRGLPRWLGGARRNAAGTSGGYPLSQIVWPGGTVDGPLVTDAWSAWKLPAVARAGALYEGMISQMPLDDVRGVEVLARPRLLDQPDPNQARAWFVARHIHDYFAHGNALHVVTVRDASAGYPAAVSWVPAHWVDIAYHRSIPGRLVYSIDGFELPFEDVIHVKRGADPWFPARGVGVVEAHMRTLDRAALEEEYERRSLREGAVPSIAVISNNPRLGESKAEDAKKRWMEIFGGAGREPVILPAGTDVKPLAWSPTDAQLVEARKMSLTDVANVFNLDGYWLGAPAGNFTYRSPGPMFLNLLRTSLEPVLAVLEGTWSPVWLPRGRTVRFDRLAITRDDFPTMVTTVVAAVNAELMSIEEGRVYLGLPPQMTGTPKKLEVPGDSGGTGGEQ
ncbi:MAG: phage portal protein [Dehalococcoidia bacterium]